MKVKEFKIVRTSSQLSMESAVNAMLAVGWELHGPMSHSISWAQGPSGRPNGHVMNELFVQAMVKPEAEGA